MKKLLLICAAILVAIGICACGGSDNSASENTSKTWTLGSAKESGVEKIDAYLSSNGEIDAKTIYSSVKYTPEMFKGVYTLNKEDDIDSFRKEHQYKEYTFTNGNQTIIPIPIEIYSGTDYMSTNANVSKYPDIKDVEDMDVAILRFATEKNDGTISCAYTVDGNKVTYKEITQDSSGKYILDPNGNTFEYTFSFSGPYLTLSNGDESATLTSYCFTERNTNGLEICGYSLPTSKLIDKLDYFYGTNSLLNYAGKRDGSYYKNFECKLTGDGKITFYLQDYEGNEFIKQYAYIAQSTYSILDDFRIILFDGTSEYYYTDDITMREARSFTVDALTDDEIKAIAEKKSSLLDELYKQFTEKGINVTIDRSTGEMAMDSAVLFGGDSAEVTSEGKALIDSFLEVYAAVAYSGEYDGFISKTIIEGHTAPLAGSTYESGLPLSQQRADNVKNYILSGTDVDASKIASSIEAVGCSNSKPIYGSDGEVDIEACRRVSFRFVVNTEK